MSHKDGIAFLDTPEKERRDSWTPGGPDLGCKLLAQRLKSENLRLGNLFLNMPRIILHIGEPEAQIFTPDFLSESPAIDNENQNKNSVMRE